MKSVLASIKPQYCELIASGKKTIEVRKTRPKCDEPFKVYIYETKGIYQPQLIDSRFKCQGSGKVIGEFVCDDISKFTAEFVNDDCHEDIRYCYQNVDDEEDYLFVTTSEKDNPNDCWLCKKSCLSFNDIKEYIGTNFHEIPFYGWHISDLVIYDEPKGLNNFVTANQKFKFDDSKKMWKFTGMRKPPQSWCYVEEV